MDNAPENPLYGHSTTLLQTLIFEQHLICVPYFRSLLRNLTGEQYEDVINVCSMFPVIDLVVKPHGESVS